MSSPVIQVENLSKKFIIAHETTESYTSLRDVISRRAQRLLGRGEKKAGPPAKEEFYALQGINFEVHAGDRVGIIGRNGAGKSTLLKILSRITEPTQGRVTIRGRVASLLEVGTGFHPELTGRENIFLNGAILGMSRAEIRKKFHEIVAFAEIEQFLDTPVKRYSSGMYVRLAFAVAAHLEPEILIVDEVLAVGDTQFQRKCLGKMEDVSKNEGRTVLFVSHNMGVINQLCGRTVLLKKGELISFGNTSDIIDLYISSDQKKENEYVPDETTNHRKVNYFTYIKSSNNKGRRTGDFSFDENIILDFEFVINNDTSNLQIGIGLTDKFQNRVSTILKPTSFFTKKDGKYVGQVIIPHSIIAPNAYSFVFALWSRTGEVFDIIDNVCPVRIYDNGTDLALYEGGDHGSFILIPTWKDVN